MQYLKDLPQLKKKRDLIFDRIISGEITEENLRKSAFYYRIQERISGFIDFEKILDSNDIVFRYSKDKSYFSKIEAEYLLITLFETKKSHIFISSYPERKNKYCESFFFNEKNDYTKNQIKMSLLYKEKTHKKSGIVEIQLDKLKKQEVIK